MRQGPDVSAGEGMDEAMVIPVPKHLANHLGAASVEYLATLPSTVPAGRFLVHNRVHPLTRRLGTRGFRAWLTSDAESLEVCGCSWAPEVGRHYRVRQAGQGHDSQQ